MYPWNLFVLYNNKIMINTLYDIRYIKYDLFVDWKYPNAT
jgi:hypothetical protein